MPTTDIDDITTKLAALELAQQEELDSIINKHRQQKQRLLLSFKQSKRNKPPSKVATTPPQVLSLNKFPLHKGDYVEIRSTASIGRKGDTAQVTAVSPNRVDIYIPHLNDKSWRIPRNLKHIV